MKRLSPVPDNFVSIQQLKIFQPDMIFSRSAAGFFMPVYLSVQFGFYLTILNNFSVMHCLSIVYKCPILLLVKPSIAGSENYLTKYVYGKFLRPGVCVL